MWDLLRRFQGITRLERRLAELRAVFRIEQARRQSEAAEIGSALTKGLAELEQRVSALDTFVKGDLLDILRAMAAGDVENRRNLWAARTDPTYQGGFTDPDPLVSIIIPTRDRPDVLTGRALPSVLAQTHARIEVVVVGDHCTPEVERSVDELGDERIVFHNLSHRLPPRDDPRKRWYTGGLMARNEGVRLAHGSWLMSFDDDDVLYPDAVTSLLRAARERRAEVAYGRFRRVAPDGVTELGDFPPQLGCFGWSAAIRHSSLRFFERELFAADFDTPNDVFMMQTMLRAGVRFTMIDDLIFEYYPSQLWPQDPNTSGNGAIGLAGGGVPGRPERARPAAHPPKPQPPPR
jgi:hypothetical protein